MHEYGDFLFYAADGYSHVIQKIWKIKKKFGCSFAYASSTSVGINMLILNSFCIFRHFTIVFFYVSKIPPEISFLYFSHWTLIKYCLN